jgi:hypothetical protein
MDAAIQQLIADALAAYPPGAELWITPGPRKRGCGSRGSRHRTRQPLGTWMIRLTDESELRVSRPDEAGWDYNEATEVHVHPSASRAQVELVFWVEPNGLTATCGSLTSPARLRLLDYPKPLVGQWIPRLEDVRPQWP